MFENAIEDVLKFTRPLHTISRSYGGLVSPGSATFFFVNDNGVAVTCKHVMNLIPSAENINQTYQKFKAERDRLPRDQKFKQYLQNLEARYKYQKETMVQLKNNFLNCFDRIDQIVCHAHPTLDLAILDFKGFHRILYQGHARLAGPGRVIRQGKSLCRIGFPFPEFTNFRHNPDTDDIEWTQTGNPNSPSFPIDGIVTRFVAEQAGGEIVGIEMSTPGLRGQSGGPLFDTEGVVYGLQSATFHLHLGFDMKDKEIVQDGRKNKVSNFPFLHVGRCVHVSKIREFLQQHNIPFATAD